MDDDGRAAGTGGGGPAADAARAAARAGVEIRAVGEVTGLRAVASLFAAVWAAPQMPPMPHDLMRSLAHAGGCVHAAFRGGQLTGASVAVFGPPDGRSCYSLITGVAPGTEGRGTGLALKLAQRAWALAAGAATMVWTFDPLLRRNARFNLALLGARVTEYLPDFYGEISDGVNDPETDRLAVSWDLRAPLPAGASPARTTPAGTGLASGTPWPSILGAGPAGEPVPGGAAPGGSEPGGAAPGGAAPGGAAPGGAAPGGAAPGGAAPGGATPGPAAPARIRCAIPPDIMAARRTDPGLARAWRLAVREHLGGALASGYQVTGYAEPGWYLLERPGAEDPR
jgi:predicted GNAT superfamily acetyltransferase